MKLHYGVYGHCDDITLRYVGHGIFSIWFHCRCCLYHQMREREREGLCVWGFVFCSELFVKSMHVSHCLQSELDPLQFTFKWSHFTSKSVFMTLFDLLVHGGQRYCSEVLLSVLMLVDGVLSYANLTFSMMFLIFSV